MAHLAHEWNVVRQYTHVCIDEGHFYPDIAWTADQWAQKGLVVIVTGLLTTHERAALDSMSQLLAQSDIREILRG